MERESWQNWDSLAYPEQSPPGGERKPAELGKPCLPRRGPAGWRERASRTGKALLTLSRARRVERESRQNWGRPMQINITLKDWTPLPEDSTRSMSLRCHGFAILLKKNSILFNIHLRFLMFVQVYRFVYFTVFKTSNISVSIQNHSDLARIRARQFC